ncbi:MAG: response regulator [Candidatus Aureabacteria bacterium]|nr:response regulator [Candidatus Auribacterota bacterium]
MGEKTILLIDDAGAYRYVLSFDLKKKGYKTLSAHNGEKGIELAENNIPDLILLDVMMPGKINGFETCQKLKSQEKTKDIPIVLVTARDDPDDIRKSVELGASGYVVKPFAFKELLVKILELIGEA